MVTPGKVEIMLLGAAQDGGLPQCGCGCDNCLAAVDDPRKAEFPASIAMIDHLSKRFWMIDATPAFPAQLRLAQDTRDGYPLEAIFLTHTHMGHYTGLMHLGREVMNTRDLPVFASARTCAFLEKNAPWSQIVSVGNVKLNPIHPGASIGLTPRLSITPLVVPHRGEFSDTFAYSIRGPSRALFYCPDIDDWDSWQNDMASFLTGIDYALLDGTFFSPDEIPPDRVTEIPHPPVTDAIERLKETACKVTFIHLNHSNPLHRDGPERARLLKGGFSVGKRGQIWALD